MTHEPDNQKVDFDVLRDAVNLARSERAPTVEILKERLREAGHPDAAIDTTITFWAESMQPTVH